MKNGSTETILAITGPERFIAADAVQFRDETCAAWNGHSAVEVDLTETTTLDCAGLGALIAVRNLAHSRNAGMRLIGAAPSVRRLLTVVRAEGLFDFVPVKPPTHPAFADASQPGSPPKLQITFSSAALLAPRQPPTAINAP